MLFLNNYAKIIISALRHIEFFENWRCLRVKINGVTVRGLRKTVVKLLLVFMTLIGGQIIFGTPVFGITNPTISITLSNLSPLELSPGDFGATSQNVSVTTNNYTGYIVNLANSVNSTDLINSSDNTLTIPTIVLPSGRSSITANEFASGYGISTDGVNYVPAPTTSNNLVIGSTNSSGSNTYTLTFGAKPASATPMGIYTKTFVITAVVNNPQYSVTYNANAGTDTVTNMPTNQSVTVSSSSTITLASDVPVRSGYSFLGWDADNTATTPTYANGSTNTIALEPTQSNAISLYAIWEATSREIHDTTTTVYSPSAVPAGYTVYFDNPSVEGNPVVTADEDGNIISFAYTDTGTNGISFTTGHSLDTGVLAFDGLGFTIHLVLTMNSNDNSGKYVVSAIKQNENASTYAGFNFWCGSTTIFYLNASKASSISGTFGSRINSSGWRVTNTEKEYTLDITYMPEPNKSISVDFTPVSTGSSSFYTDSTNLSYIPDNLDGATIILSGNGLNTSKDLSNVAVHEFSVTKIIPD